MSLDSFLNIISGLGLFLYGMKLLTDSLGGFAGSDMNNILKKATKTPLKGVLLGACVTGVIQSSTATTLMCMGLVNSNSINIFQALPVIMGANIGTTVTAQILSLADISSENILLSILKPSSFAPFFLLIGTVELLFFKKKETHQNASIFIGLGILFIGMETMESGLSPLSDLPEFQEIFLKLKNPVLSMLLGVAATAIIQSSSVSIGILQTLSTTGAITFSTAVPIILGMNIGKCLPEFIASISTGKEARQTIFADLLVNFFGALSFFISLYVLNYFFDLPFWENTATRSMIAFFHTVFNISTTLFLLPFYKKIIGISKKAIK